MHRPAIFSTSRGAHGGFTLSELLLSFVALTLVALVAISSFFSQTEVTLHNATRLLADDIRTAQNRAMLLQVPVALRFEEDGDGYAIEDLGFGPAHLKELIPPVARRYSADGVFEGVRVRQLDLGGATQLRFDAQGRAERGATITLGYEGETRSVVIDAGRGIALRPDSTRNRGWLDWLR